MLSIKPLASAKAACDYYMQTIEYYQSDATSTQWLGKTQSFLKLESEIQSETFLHLLQGHLPNGQKLKNQQGEHRPGFDMTFSAPKSVSVLVGLGVAPDFIRFHDEAVKYAIQKIESEFAETRVRVDGQLHYEKTGNLLVAAFRQPSSRANDPALHTHCVALNLTFLDGKARSLASDKSRNHGVVEKIQNHAHYCGLLYRQHLANGLKDAGFSLRMVGDGLFEIDGVPEAVLSEFSRRREDIERLMKENGWEGAKLASMATLLTRAGKEIHDPKTLEEDWQARAKALDFDARAFMQTRGQVTPRERWFDIIKERLSSFFRKTNQPPSEQEAAKACVDIAIETLSQRVSVFSERDLREASLKNSLLYEKSISHEHIQSAIDEQMKAQNLYSAQCPRTQETLLTTPWLLTLEAESIARIEHNKGLMKPIATLEEVRLFQKTRAANLAYPMTASQKEAMKNLLTNKDRFIAIQGYAGVAKTTMLAETRLLMEEKGFQLRGITIASIAGHELQMKAGIRSDVFPVVHQELQKAKTGSLTKTVFVNDEASMLSSPQAHALFKHIERTQARLILVGDKAQLLSINNGRIFGLVQDYGINTSIMDEIVRQKNPELKKAVVYATQGNVKAALEKLDVQEIASHEERIAWIANQWISLPKEQRQATLLFAARHSDRAEITEQIRAALKKEGTLHGETVAQTILKPKAIEAIQLRYIANYQKGDVLRFNQDFQKHGIKKSQYYTVSQMTKKHRQDNVLPLIDEQGKTKRFALQSLPQYKTHTAPFERLVELCRPSELKLNIGDKLMWTRNFKSSNVRNGDTLTLHAIQDKELLFTTKENNTIIFEKNHLALKHLDYSYVLTNYKVQGKDASYGIGLMESHNRFGSTLKNFYVQISRAVDGMTLVTDDKNLLIDAIQRNNDEKQASIDVLSAKQLVDHGMRFNEKALVSIQPVINKKMAFEINEQVNQRQVEALRFEKNQHIRSHHKELER